MSNKSNEAGNNCGFTGLFPGITVALDDILIGAFPRRNPMSSGQRLLITVVLVVGCAAASAQTPPSSLRVLRNNDVIRMVEKGQKSNDIIAVIFTSYCNFDTYPPVLRDLRRRGIPETVIAAMTAVPYGPPSLKPREASVKDLTLPVTIPTGTIVEVETTRPFSSANLSVGSPVTFLVTKRIFINNSLVIDRGALAQGHVVKVKRASGWGRPGMLAWEMDEVVAVDGSKIKVRVGSVQTGKSRTAAVTGGALATGAVIFPYSSPVALIWGLKKGDEAVLRGSRIFAATTGTPVEVAGLRPPKGGVVYRDRETVKASDAPPTSTNFDSGGYRPRESFRPRP